MRSRRLLSLLSPVVSLPLTKTSLILWWNDSSIRHHHKHYHRNLKLVSVNQQHGFKVCESNLQLKFFQYKRFNALSLLTPTRRKKIALCYIIVFFLFLPIMISFPSKWGILSPCCTEGNSMRFTKNVHTIQWTNQSIWRLKEFKKILLLSRQDSFILTCK